MFTTGCHEEPPVAFDPNFVHAMKYQVREEVPTSQAMKDIYWVTDQMFGSPDDPKLPDFVAEDEDYASLVSMDHLVAASGPIDAEGRGLFRKHCVTCHGISGDGRGPTASVQNPYPRDYRRGTFKFTTTPRGEKPVREDIAKLIRNGISGTAMVKIADLTEDDVQALTDYVIYLSWRGELERALMDEAVLSGDYDFEEGDRVIVPEDKDLKEGDPEPVIVADASATDGDNEDEDDAEDEVERLTVEERVENYADGWDFAVELAEDIASAWIEADDEVTEIPERPTDIPVTDNYAEFVAWMDGDQKSELVASVNRGQEVFLSKTAACSTCHGKSGLGDGQTTDFDDWTKDWTINAGVKPDDADAIVPFLARGALPPINAKPRNFENGLFHGGESASDLYLRIIQGIDGTPMPAATFVDGQFEEEDVWHLINFIRSRKFEAEKKKEAESSKAPAPETA